MRTAIFKTLLIGALGFPVAFATGASADAYSDAVRTQPGTPYTPSGRGDPEAIVCRAPQPLPSGGLGPKSCVRNIIWARLTNTGKDLSADGRSVFDRPTVEDPSGEGPPDAVTCRTPQQMPTAWHLPNAGPLICLTNDTWAELKARRWQITADGKSYIDLRRPAMSIPGAFGSFGNGGLSLLPAQVVR